MATRIAKDMPVYGLQKDPPSTREMAKKYKKWLAMKDGTCVVTGQPVWDFAHSGGISEGKGTGKLAAMNTLLPLVTQLHRIEEKERYTFWRTVGLPDYLDVADRLHKAYLRDGDPTPILAGAQRRVDREYVCALLGEVGF